MLVSRKWVPLFRRSGGERALHAPCCPATRFRHPPITRSLCPPTPLLQRSRLLEANYLTSYVDRASERSKKTLKEVRGQGGE